MPAGETDAAGHIACRNRQAHPAPALQYWVTTMWDSCKARSQPCLCTGEIPQHSISPTVPKEHCHVAVSLQEA